MKHPIRDFIIGVTAIAGMVGLFALLWLVGELSLFRTPTYPLMLHMDNTGGVLPAAGITLNGVRIGNVRSVRTDEDPRLGVVLTLAIEQNVRVPRDVKVSIVRELVGAATLSLTAGAEGGAEPVGPPDFFRPGERFDSKAYAPGLTGELSSLLDSRLAKFEVSVEKFNTLADTYTGVGQRVREMLEPRSLSDVESGAVPANISTVVERFDRAVSDARGWLGDASLRADAQGAVKKFADAIDHADDLISAWKSAAETVTQSAGQATENFDRAATEFADAARKLGETVHLVQGLLGEVQEGKGTVGALMKNPDLYRNLNDAAARMEQALTEAKLLIEKYRKEGIPIRF